MRRFYTKASHSNNGSHVNLPRKGVYMDQTMQQADLSCPLPAARSRQPEVNVIPPTKRPEESGGATDKRKNQTGGGPPRG